MENHDNDKGNNQTPVLAQEFPIRYSDWVLILISTMSSTHYRHHRFAQLGYETIQPRVRAAGFPLKHMSQIQIKGP